MKFTYDKEADAAYIYFKYPIKDGAVKETKEVSDSIFLDFDANQKLLGVEILNTSRIMTKKALVAKTTQ